MSELDDLLRELGWNRSGLARRLGLHVNTVSHWRHCGVPDYALAYLRSSVLHQRTANDLLEKLAREGNPLS